MVVSADTSFLFSLYGNDANSSRAVAWVKENHRAIAITCLNEYELGNALRFAESRRLLPAGSAAMYGAQFATDRNQGRLVLEPVNLAKVIDEAKRISEIHTLTRGYRAFDILHVAAALVLQAKTFLTFDANQRALAKSEKLTVPL